MVQTTDTHAYLKTHRLGGQLLRFQLTAEAEALRAQASGSKTGRAAKTLVKEGRMRITQVALEKGARLQSHHVEGAVSLHIMRGRLQLTTGAGEMYLASGDLAALDEDVAHAAVALSECVILITTAMP